MSPDLEAIQSRFGFRRYLTRQSHLEGTQLSMEISSFAEDPFELKDFSLRLESFIEVEQEFVPGSLVLALSSKFGSGKSTFLKMWKASIDSRELNKPAVISLNAWESDYYGDPLFAILSSLIDQVEPEREDGMKRITEAAKDVGWLSLAIGGQVVTKATGIDLVSAGEYADQKKSQSGDRKLKPIDAFSAFESRKVAMRELKLAIKEFIKESKTQVLFFIDELDRCKPSYAIEFLETVKHIFDLEGATFILAIDRNQLQSSITVEFGTDVDFEEYLRKFVDREISLPPISKTGFEKLASLYVPHYLGRTGVRGSYFPQDDTQQGNLTALAGALQMTPRQIQEAFRILGHSMSKSERSENTLHWCFVPATIAMAFFRVANRELYEKIGRSQLSAKEAGDILRGFFDEYDALWWFSILMTGGALTNNDEEDLSQRAVRAGFTMDENPRRDAFTEFSRGWRHVANGFPKIYVKMEQLSQFG